MTGSYHNDLPPRPSWRGRITFIFFMAPAVAILIYAYHSQKLFETHTIEEFQNHQLTTVTSAARAVEERLTNTEHELKNDLAKAPLLSDSNTAKAYLALETVYEELKDSVHVLYYLDTRGALLASFPARPDPPVTGVSETSLIDQALASPGQVISKSFRSDHGYELIAVSAVLRDGVPVGVVAAVQDLNSIVSEFISPLTTIGQGSVFLVDDRGLFLYHSEEHHIGKRLEDVAESDYYAGLLRQANEQGPASFFKYKKPGSEERLVAFSSIALGDTNFLLFQTIPRNVLAGPILKSKRTSWGFAGLFTLIVAIGAFKLTDLRNRKAALDREIDLSEEVRTIKEFYEGLVEAAGDAIVAVNRQGTVLTWNTGAERILENPAEKALGRNYRELQRGEISVDLDDLTQRAFAGEVFSNVDIQTERADGSRLDLLVTVSPVRDPKGEVIAIQGILKDITERKMAEESLWRTKTLLAKTFASLNEAVFVLEPASRTIIACNPAVERIFGYSENEVVGRNTEFLYIRHDDYETFGCEMFSALEKFGVYHGEHRLRRKDGRFFASDHTVTEMVDEAGRRTALVSVIGDLTERKRAEEQLLKARRGLKKAHHELEQVKVAAVTSERLAALGRLTAGVSHEILNPLNAITLGLHLLIIETDNPAEVVEQAKEMLEQAGRIAKIAQDLLLFARQRPPERRQLDLGDIVTSILALLEYELKLKGIEVDLRLAEELPYILADQSQLQQMVLNLLTNARDAMPDGGRLTLKTSEIEPVITGNDRVLELRVEDTGEGIPPEHRDKIFDPFFTTKSEGQGTGLGLSICQGIVEGHGGSIWAEDAPGGGTALVVRLRVGDQ